MAYKLDAKIEVVDGFIGLGDKAYVIQTRFMGPTMLVEYKLVQVAYDDYIHFSRPMGIDPERYHSSREINTDFKKYMFRSKKAAELTMKLS